MTHVWRHELILDGCTDDVQKVHFLLHIDASDQTSVDREYPKFPVHEIRGSFQVAEFSISSQSSWPPPQQKGVIPFHEFHVCIG